jgi:hypothetical protein
MRQVHAKGLTGMQIKQVQLSKSDFEKMPERERLAILLLGHFANEINILSKLLIMSSNRMGDHNTAERRAHHSQTLVIGRLFAGKLFEGWNVIKAQYFGTKLSREYTPLLDDKAKAALDNLKTYFSNAKNPIRRVRNKLASHYDEDVVKEAFSRVPEAEDWEFLIARNYG